MKSTKLMQLAMASGTLTVALVLNSAVVFGQPAGTIQLAANRAAGPGTSVALSPTLSALEERLDAQQQQIDELTALVSKLEARLQGAEAPTLLARAAPPSNSAPVPTPVPAPVPTPAPPAPAPATAVTAAYRAPRELLPDIGHIGAEVGLFLGGATNPYKDNKGFATGGYIDLPFKNVAGGKLSYEIMIGMQRSKTQQTSTSGVNALVNAALNSYLGNTGANSTSPTNFLTGPLPITSTTQENSKVLTVAPVLLKYSLHNMGRFRPYIVGGLATYVWIGSNDNTQSFDAVKALGSLAGAPVGSSTLGATLNAILQGSQIGGLAPTSPELAARGVPHGQGNLLFGGQFGGGFEVRVTPKFSMGVDVRRNQVEGTNSSFTTFAFKQGLHW
jgi:hypothetical protein